MPDTHDEDNRTSKFKAGLILTGGGARAAYQVGVLKAVAECLPENTRTPFPIICGTSAGAINAAKLACRADNFRQGVGELVEVWNHFRVEQVFRTDAGRAIVNGLRWFLTLSLGGLGGLTPKSLLDNSPLRALLEKKLSLQDIQRWIDVGILHAFSVTTVAYTSGRSVTFFQGRDDLRPWKRTRRIGIPRPITLDYLMASSAIPILFPGVRIGYEYYGDGSMRQMAPLSPALHLGADRLLIIGARHEEGPERLGAVRHRLTHPSLGEISGFILDTLFMDSLSTDVERLKRINHTLSYIPEDKKNNTPLRHIEALCIFPSEEIHSIVQRHAKEFPRSVRYLLHSVGAMKPGGQPLMSYLMFEEDFCRELIELGYRDALRFRRQILRLLVPQQETSLS